MKRWIGLGIAVAVGGSASALAQDYPARPVRAIVPAAAGSATDTVARVFGRKMGELLGQPIVIENRLGANGVIGAEFVAKSAPDGYMLLFSTNGPNATATTIMKSVPYDPFRAFTPVTLLGALPQVFLVSVGSPHRSLADVVAFARANPGKLPFASSNSVQRVSVEALSSMAGVKMLNVPYKSSPQAMTDLIAGEVGLYVADMIIALPQIKAGKVRPLAVTTMQRTSGLPEVPTVAEAANVPGYELTGIFALFGPAGLAPAIVAKLNAAAVKAAGDPEVRTPLGALGVEIVTSSPEGLTKRFREELAVWTKVTRDAGMEPE